MIRIGWMLQIVLLLAWPSLTQAADRTASYPEKPVRVIVPADATSATTLLARILGVGLGKALGAQFVIDSRLGASGVIGLELVAHSAPDGYTLLGTGPGIQVVTPQLQKNLSFDAARDFVPIAMYASSPNVLAVHPALPARSVAELLALAKRAPGTLNMAYAGVGSQAHLAGMQFILLSGINVLPVPYKGGGALVAAVIANESQFTVTPLPAVLPHALSGRLRALGVGGSQRAAKLPDVPTIAEAGVPGYLSTGWAGLMAPRGVAPSIMQKLHASVQQVIKQPETREAIEQQGAEVVAGTPAEFGALLRDEWDRYSRVIKAAGIKTE